MPSNANNKGNKNCNMGYHETHRACYESGMISENSLVSEYYINGLSDVSSLIGNEN